LNDFNFDHFSFTRGPLGRASALDDNNEVFG
jgi:hypothetical protein